MIVSYQRLNNLTRIKCHKAENRINLGVPRSFHIDLNVESIQLRWGWDQWMQQYWNHIIETIQIPNSTMMRLFKRVITLSLWLDHSRILHHVEVHVGEVLKHLLQQCFNKSQCCYMIFQVINNDDFKLKLQGCLMFDVIRLL